MITTLIPATWEDLQNQCARILTECGFKTETEKVVRLVRGAKEIDVHAEESVQGRLNRIFCECKHWKTRVPQDVIHGFRTVLADGGANAGYIISMAGFQSGSIDAADLTTVNLVTWPEFQAAFEETWLQNFFIPQVTERLDPLMTFTEPLRPDWFSKLPDNDKDAFVELQNEHFALAMLAMQFSRYVRIMGQVQPKLPLSSPHVHDDMLRRLPEDVRQAEGYRELLEAMLTVGEQAIAEFRAIRDRNGLSGGE